MNTRLMLASMLVAFAVSSPALAQGPRYRLNQNNTPGWTLMTPDERAEHQKKMLSAKTYEECKQIQEEHHKAMEARAREQGVTLNAPRYNACDRMKARGFFK